MSAFLPRAVTDRRTGERRWSAEAFAHAERRTVTRRSYLDRRQGPAWRQRWLRSRVIAVLREGASAP